MITQAPSLIADEPVLTVVPGGSVSGVIDPDGDTDDITVNLVAGQTYLISLRGTGVDPLFDSFLRVFNPDGTQLATDDDGGNDLYSVVTITAAVTGTYTIRAASFDNGSDDTGGWTVDVRQRGADEALTAITPGTYFGFIKPGPDFATLPPQIVNDADTYSFTLQAGKFYTFKVAGGIDSNGVVDPGELDTFILLHNGMTVLAQNDDNAGNDFSSSLGFFAQTTGTYYLQVTAYTGNSGGYVVDFQEIDLATQDPLDAINWFSADNIDTVDVGGVPTAYVYFGAEGETFGELNDDGTGPRESYGWNAREIQQVMLALEEFSKIIGINYEITTDVNQADFRLITTTSALFGAYFYPQDEGFWRCAGHRRVQRR